jgi:benzylsuccinate CoA-transferase BbsE subunit
MLDDIRVLEISAPETMMAGRVLADLGADVIVIEPPGGAAGRRIEPFIDDIPGIERSLTWNALNRNKRGITIDIASHDGRALFRELAPKFDVVFDSGGAYGTAPLDDVELPPAMIRCTLSAFQRSGPKSHFTSSDIVTMAASGAPGMTGDPDRPPIFYPVQQSLMEGGADAAIAALAALGARDRDGIGQSTEVSVRLAAMIAAFSSPIAMGAGNREMPRSSGRISIAGVAIPNVWECADGFVLISIAFGPAFGPMTQRLVKLAADEGHLERRVAELNWPNFISDLQKKAVTPDDLKAAVDGIGALCRAKTKSEIGAAARELGLLAAPVMDMKDIAESEQYRARGLFASVTLRADAKQIDVPVRFAQFSNYSIETRSPAPSLSEHTNEFLTSELGLSAIEIQALFVHGVI